MKDITKTVRRGSRFSPTARIVARYCRAANDSSPCLRTHWCAVSDTDVRGAGAPPGRPAARHGTSRSCRRRSSASPSPRQAAVTCPSQSLKARGGRRSPRERFTRWPPAGGEPRTGRRQPGGTCSGASPRQPGPGQHRSGPVTLCTRCAHRRGWAIRAHPEHRLQRHVTAVPQGSVHRQRQIHHVGHDMGGVHLATIAMSLRAARLPSRSNFHGRRKVSSSQFSNYDARFREDTPAPLMAGSSCRTTNRDARLDIMSKAARPSASQRVA